MTNRILVALLVVSGLLLSGCKDGDGPDADPSTPAPQSTSATPIPSDGSSSSTGVAPATGPLVEDDVFRFHLPADAEWELGREGLSATTYDEDLNAFDVATSVLPLQAGRSEDDLDVDFDISTDSDGYDPPQKRGKNRVVDGIEGWTAETVEDGQLIYTFGTMHARHSFDITFHFPKKDPRTRAWIESVLASIQWK
ncbi:hypothetical protein ACOACQ_07800 [Nocardioides sp. CPCC 206347]|uniref:hypothetical protein n=1 Tax=unclassified Nocardioides TaxID=2615069 RepID=UPI00360E094E